MAIKNRNIARDAKISPAKLDRYEQYVVMKPSASTTWVVDTEDVSGGDVSGATINNARCDYPRNLLLSATDNSGTDLSVTATVTGKDQFGNTISEQIGSATGAASAAGSKIFATITSVSMSVSGNAASDTASIGFVIANSDTAKLGFPFKIDAYDDVKMVTWVDNGTNKMEAVASADVDTTYHAYQPNNNIAAADDYVFLVKPSKWKKDQSTDAGL